MAAYGGAAPYRSREGLTTRPVSGSDEIQLRIDPMHADLDDEITGLRSQVRKLRNVAEEIGTEARFQNDFIDQLGEHEGRMSSLSSFPPHVNSSLSESCFVSGAFTANDSDQSSSRGQEQCKEIEQEHCPLVIALSAQCESAGASYVQFPSSLKEWRQ
ncbi:hypothetical protein FNV43_RR11701 [Rhamnella rubrinervis]|uniref:t-SNARE coiled-coil homology domain-containing protein n=1 Tax=Rhamnella rubrinervis TaxID=2594499 RepID=A0A8K0H605_9ROSA|nr:hypothetical protein FNV43_RR11701 [Rhamnella rubrinervis]